MNSNMFLITVSWTHLARKLIKIINTFAVILALTACANPDYYPQQVYPIQDTPSSINLATIARQKVREDQKNYVLNRISAKCARHKNQNECKINKINAGLRELNRKCRKHVKVACGAAVAYNDARQALKVSTILTYKNRYGHLNTPTNNAQINNDNISPHYSNRSVRSPLSLQKSAGSDQQNSTNNKLLFTGHSSVSDCYHNGRYEACDRVTNSINDLGARCDRGDSDACQAAKLINDREIIEIWSHATDDY